MWWLAFLTFNLCVVYSDFRYRRVPNRLLLTALAWYAFCLLASRTGWLSFGAFSIPWSQACWGFVIALLIFFPLWQFDAVAAGDVKYLAVLGFALGPALAWPIVVLGSLLCGLHALMLILSHGWLAVRLPWWQGDRRKGLPYAAHLAIAGILWLGYFHMNAFPWQA